MRIPDPIADISGSNGRATFVATPEPVPQIPVLIRWFKKVRVGPHREIRTRIVSDTVVSVPEPLPHVPLHIGLLKVVRVSATCFWIETDEVEDDDVNLEIEVPHQVHGNTNGGQQGVPLNLAAEIFSWSVSSTETDYQLYLAPHTPSTPNLCHQPPFAKGPNDVDSTANVQSAPSAGNITLRPNSEVPAAASQDPLPPIPSQPLASMSPLSSSLNPNTVTSATRSLHPGSDQGCGEPSNQEAAALSPSSPNEPFLEQTPLLRSGGPPATKRGEQKAPDAEEEEVDEDDEDAEQLQHNVECEEHTTSGRGEPSQHNTPRVLPAQFAVGDQPQTALRGSSQLPSPPVTTATCDFSALTGCHLM